MHLFTNGHVFVQKQAGGIGSKRRLVYGRNYEHQGNGTGTGQWKPALQSIAELGV